MFKLFGMFIFIICFSGCFYVYDAPVDNSEWSIRNYGNSISFIFNNDKTFSKRRVSLFRKSNFEKSYKLVSKKEKINDTILYIDDKNVDSGEKYNYRIDIEIIKYSTINTFYIDLETTLKFEEEVELISDNEFTKFKINKPRVNSKYILFKKFDNEYKELGTIQNGIYTLNKSKSQDREYYKIKTVRNQNEVFSNVIINDPFYKNKKDFQKILKKDLISTKGISDILIDNDLLIISNLIGEVIVYNKNNFKLVKKINCSYKEINGIRLINNALNKEKYLLVYGNDWQIKTYDMNNNFLLKNVFQCSSIVSDVIYNEKLNCIFYSMWNGQVNKIDFTNNKKELLKTHDDIVLDIEMSNEYLYSSSYDGYINEINLDTKKIEKSYNLKERISKFIIYKDRIIYSTADFKIKVFDIVTNKKETLVDETSYISKLKIVEENLIYSTYNKKIKVVKLFDKSMFKEIEFFEKVESFEVIDKKRVFVGLGNGVVLEYDLNENKITKDFSDIIFSKDLFCFNETENSLIYLSEYSLNVLNIDSKERNQLIYRELDEFKNSKIELIYLIDSNNLEIITSKNILNINLSNFTINKISNLELEKSDLDNFLYKKKKLYSTTINGFKVFYRVNEEMIEIYDYETDYLLTEINIKVKENYVDVKFSPDLNEVFIVYSDYLEIWKNK